MEYYSSLDASQLDSETPTLFELISASQLESLLSPSLRYILVHYASRYPKYLLQINNRFDELNLVLRGFVEWYFVQYWHGSFTENFYGLKRVNQTPLNNGKYNANKITSVVPAMVEERRALTSLQKLVSVFEIAGTAYLSEKLNYCYEIWYTKYVTNQLNTHESNSKEENLRITLKRKFVEIYPYVQSAYRAANFTTTLLYLSGHSKSPTLLTYLFRMNYTRLGQYDYAKHEPKPVNPDIKKPNRTAPKTTSEIVTKFLSKYLTNPSWKLVSFILGTFFPVAIFSLKFLEWWNNSDFASKLSKNSGNVLDFTLPPPGLVTQALKEAKEANRKAKKYSSSKTCPICKNELTNPAIIETGYVFDYACIYNYLEKSHIIVNDKLKQRKYKEDDDDDEYNDEESEIDSEVEEEEKEKEEEEPKEYVPKQEQEFTIDINKGGRCPVTGRKLLGCKWNAIKNEWEIEGIRRLIF